MKESNHSSIMRRMAQELRKAGGDVDRLLSSKEGESVVDQLLTEALREEQGLGWPAPASAAEDPPLAVDEATLKQWEEDIGDFLVKKHGRPPKAGGDATRSRT